MKAASHNNAPGVRHAGRENIFLIGLMGAGKTTVGRMLARRLGLQFVDSDHEIELRCGVTIPVIFEIEGEAGFRLREEQAIADLTARDGIVLATGGGAVLSENNRRLLAERGTVIYLMGAPEELNRRIGNDRNRPLLAGVDRLERLRALHVLRDPIYRSIADMTVESGVRSAQTLARELIARLAGAQSHAAKSAAPRARRARET